MAVKTKTCIDKAADILSRRQHSVCELRRKLFQAKYVGEEVDSAVFELGRMQFLDDAKFAKSFAEELVLKGFGFSQIKLKLAKRGIQKDDIEVALSCLKESGDLPNELESARKTLEKKIRTFDRESDPRKRKAKIYRFLLSRGFSAATVAELLRGR